MRYFFGLVLAILLLLTPTFSFAKETLPLGETTASASPTPKLEYQLPYPGLLPGHPLYNLKMLRDRIVAFFIADPIKKAEFDLLQANKRLSAGMALFAKKNPDEELAVSTISKGEDYFEEGVARAREAKRQGINTNKIFADLSTAAKKHREILLQLFQKAKSKKAQIGLQALLQRVGKFEETAAAFLPKQK